MTVVISRRLKTHYLSIRLGSLKRRHYSQIWKLLRSVVGESSRSNRTPMDKPEKRHVHGFTKSCLCHNATVDDATKRGDTDSLRRRYSSQIPIRKNGLRTNSSAECCSSHALYAGGEVSALLLE